MLRLQCVEIFPFPRPKSHFTVKKGSSHAIMIRIRVGDSDFKRQFARQPVHGRAKLFRGVRSRL